MAEKLPFEDPIRRVIEANVRYYEALAKVANDYWRAVLGVWREFPIRGAAPPANPAPGVPLQPREATLVLEARSGEEAQGVFLVENRLSRQVSTPVVTSGFADRSGREIQPTLRIIPGIITLQPGARTLVQIVAVVTDDLEPGVAYRGEVTVPDLSEQAIPVLVRRREGPAPQAAESSNDRARTGAGGSKRKRRPARRRARES
ncbi:MAG: hypothetical protein ACREMX_15220 [Gemmatimonadales bacterium]